MHWYNMGKTKASAADPTAPLREFVERGGHLLLREHFLSWGERLGLPSSITYVEQEDAWHEMVQDDQWRWFEDRTTYSEVLGNELRTITDQVLDAVSTGYLQTGTQEDGALWLARLADQIQSLYDVVPESTPYDKQIRRGVSDVLVAVRNRQRTGRGANPSAKRPGRPPKEPNQEDPIEEMCQQLATRKECWNSSGEINLRVVRDRLALEGLGTHLSSKQLNRKIKAAVGEMSAPQEDRGSGTELPAGHN